MSTTKDTTYSQKSDFHQIQSDTQRRAAIQVLQNTASEIMLEELAERVSTIHSPGFPVEKTEIRLHHVHLPMLSDAGLVAYDRAESEVSPIDSTDDLLT